MADEFIPELTLNPNSPLAGQGQAAAAPAPAAASTPPSEAHLPESDLDEAKLSPAQRKAVEDFARTIDITDSNVVLQYGAAAQKNVSEFSENTLQQIRTKDLGQIGETLADLVRQLQEFDPEEEKKGLCRLFPPEKESAGRPESRVRQSLRQRGSNCGKLAGPPDHPDEGRGQPGPDV